MLFNPKKIQINSRLQNMISPERVHCSTKLKLSSPCVFVFNLRSSYGITIMIIPRESISTHFQCQLVLVCGRLLCRRKKSRKAEKQKLGASGRKQTVLYPDRKAEQSKAAKRAEQSRATGKQHNQTAPLRAAASASADVNVGARPFSLASSLSISPKSWCKIHGRVNYAWVM